MIEGSKRSEGIICRATKDSIAGGITVLLVLPNVTKVAPLGILCEISCKHDRTADVW